MFRIKSTLAALAILAFNAYACAKDANVKTDEGITVTYALNSTDKIARVKGYSETTKSKITIPSKIKVDGTTYTVTKIGVAAFKFAGFKTIILPNTITLIDTEAFADSWLTNFTMPTKVEYIKKQAFKGTLMKSVNIPGTCSEIGEEAFSNNKIENLTISESRTPLTIGVDAFAHGCIKALILPYRVSSIGDGAFLNNDITTLQWSSAFATIPARCFYRCSQLKEINVPLGVTTIGESAFSACPKLTQLNLPTSLRIIDQWAFFNSGVAGVNIPEGVTTINSDAFGNCDNLRYAYLPSTLKTIGCTCFQGCDNLMEVYCDATVPPVCGASPFSDNTFDNATLHVPQNVWRAYAEADWWAGFNYKHYAGIDDITTDPNDSTTKYYNTNGYQISQPQPGHIYIQIQRGKAHKVIR